MNLPEPAWLTAKVDQRLAEIKEPMLAAANVSEPTIIATYLAEPDHEPSPDEIDLWERTCDRCDTYIPDDGEFYTGHVVREVEGRQVMLTFGVCAPCKDVT